jgi:hypothetical protein
MSRPMPRCPTPLRRGPNPFLSSEPSPAAEGPPVDLAVVCAAGDVGDDHLILKASASYHEIPSLPDGISWYTIASIVGRQLE